MSQIIISQIELFNFKSFKGKHVIKGLEPHFNTIIGPNGSGKSNIIDSILFVLGFKAKKMRHKLNSDLIYQGDTKEKECFVEITFVKGNEILKVKRKLVHNKSFYYINDKEVQQKELVVFMENEGVDIENNRFLILQGEIESISLMKPKNNGMLEYIEDAIGTSKYILQIEELEKEKKIKEDIFENKATEFKFNEKEFQFIKEKKESNEKLLKEYVDKISKISELCNLEESKNKIEQLELEENLKNVNEEINKINEKNKDIKKKMALNEERLHSKKKKINKKENALNDAKQKFYDVDKINALNENKKERIKKNIKDLKNNLEIKRDKNAVYEKEKIIFEKEIAINKNLKSEYEKKIAQFKKEIKEIKPKNEEAKINQELKNHESDLISLAKKKDDLNEQIYNYKKDIEKKNDLEEMLKENLNEVEERIKKLTEEKITLEKEIYDLEHKIFSLKRDLSEKENNLSIFENEEENQNRQSKAISILKKVDGFIGRLGNLGTTKKEFDVAVSTAGKGNLNNFVVNNTETAEKCIEILKKNSLERSSFIVMDKIKDFTLNGNFDYLIDKIECEEKYRKLFYFAFGETILCSNLEEGKKIAFGNVRRKVVTLDGKMIEKSGLMSGGGFFKGSMKTEKFAFKKCKEEIEGIKKEINLLNEEKDKRSKTLLKIKHELSEKEDYMEKKSKIMPKEMILKELKKLNKIIEDEDFDKLENEKLNIEKLINENQENINKKQEKLDELEDMTIRHKRGELSILFDQLEGVNNKILDNKKKLDNIELFNIKEIENQINQLEIELDNFEEIKDYQKRKSEKEKFENELKDLYTELKEIFELIKEIKETLGKDFNREIELTNTLNEITEKLDKLKKNKKILKSRKSNVEAELLKYEKFVEKKIDEKINYEFEELIELIKRKEREIKDHSINENFDLSIFKEFETKKCEFNKNQKDFNSYKKELSDLKENLIKLQRIRKNEFLDGLDIINKNLKEIYQIITFGGNAELELVDYFDPFTEGINLSVMPPKKSWKNVSTLSGGEKTLSSLALVFALHVYKPSPFYVMDEIDAALDFRNVSIISNYIYEKTKNAQFLIISLRNDMFEKSNILIGVYKNNNLSKLTVFNINEIKKEQARRKAINSN